MAIDVPIHARGAFTVSAPLSQVFDTVADVATSARFFPNLARWVDLGDGIYRWELERLGTSQVHLEAVFASRHEADRGRGTVVWTPVEGVGNALVGGDWLMTAHPGGATNVRLSLGGTVSVSLPAFMKVVVVSVVRGEFDQLIQAYIRNLVAHFGGAL